MPARRAGQDPIDHVGADGHHGPLNDLAARAAMIEIHDTIAILREEGEDGALGSVGGVFHCFTETERVARAALDMGFFISFSGILTFKSASSLREVASLVPMDRLLIETDSPYLAPVPYRGKTNNPAYVPYVAAELARLRGCSIEEIAKQTSENFDRLFLRSA